MMDFAQLQQVAQEAPSSAAQIKAALPITFVLEQYGIQLDEAGGKYQALCPFHPDTTPSLDVFGENLERFGCFACGAKGDVLDLIGRLAPAPTFSEQKLIAEQFLTEIHDTGWSGPRVGITKQFDAEAARQTVAQSQVNFMEPIITFLTEKREESVGLMAVEPEWLHEVFEVGAWGNEIVIPYKSRNGNLVTYKRRLAGTKSRAAEGSDLSAVLYGEWRDTDPSKTVILAEGETDVWAATAALPEYMVLGLPTGAGAHPKQAPSLRDRKVILAFDGDLAGRTAALAWWRALVREGTTEVLVVSLPDKTDLASTADIRGLIARARPVPESPTGMQETPLGYIRPALKEDGASTPLSNWVFVPGRELLGSEGSAYEGTILPSGQSAVLTSFDLSSKSRLVAWSTRNGGSWYGTDRDGQLLLGQLQARGPFLSPGRMVSTAGLVDHHFVWPGGVIGPDHYVYVDPPASVGLETRMSLAETGWNPQEPMFLRELHQHRVTDPILAWLAAAPVRSLLREFPVLAVTGGSGSGKTTLMETMVGHFSGSMIASNLTSTTRHAIFAFVGSTNGFPVWFDEYRPGARKDAITTLDQVLRDAYTSQGSAKGGMGERWAEVVTVAATAPLIVSGEDAFSETSHTERMALVSLPVHGRNPDTLARVKALGQTGFAHAYLTWIHDGLREGWLPQIINRAAGPTDLPARQQLNLGVLHLGWTLLTEFLQDYNVVLDAPDFSLVEAEGAEASQHNPIKDAILWALAEPDAMMAIRYVAHPDGPMIYMRPENFVQFISRAGTFTLPGGATAIRKYIEGAYGGTRQRSRVFTSTTQQSVLGFPASAVGYMNEVD